MGEIEELERSLQENWDFDALALYGDALQQAGDPRGELIAFDLAQRANRAAGRKLAGPREGVRRRWLGKEWADDTERCVVGTLYGMVALAGWRLEQLAPVLAEPFSRYLRKLRLQSSIDLLGPMLDAVAAEPRPWLEQLSIRRVERTDYETQQMRRAGVPIPGGSMPRHAALVAATPNLKQLDVRGRTAVFAEFVHPGVRQLSISGLANLRALAQKPWPSVEYVAFAFGHDSVLDGSLDEIAALFSAFPKLQTIDLGRNEPTPPDADYQTGARHQAGGLRVFELVSRLPPVRVLRVPSLRDESDVATLQATLDRRPALEALDVVKMYRAFPTCELRHPTAKITIPVASPWPAEDQIQPRLELVFEVGETECPMRFHRAIALMEVAYVLFTDGERQAWDRVWSVVDDLLGPVGAAEIEASVLYRAADVIELVHEIYDVYGLVIEDHELQHLVLRLEPLARSKQRVAVRTVIAG